MNVLASSSAPSSIPSQSARLKILDRGESRRDLAARTETKFTLQLADISKLRNLLMQRCQHQIHNESVSVVRSVYFDDARLSACYANLHGNGQRRKLRLRWYDTLAAPERFFFEIKWRNNRVTGKHRLEVLADRPLHELTFSELTDRLTSDIPTDYLPDVLKFPDPIVIVQYHRQHFISPDSSLRLTLDYDLTFYDQVGKSKLCTEFGRQLDGFVVMEGKTPIGREHELRDLVHPFTPRADRCSKYVHGCRLLGHIRRGE